MNTRLLNNKICSPYTVQISDTRNGVMLHEMNNLKVQDTQGCTKKKILLLVIFNGLKNSDIYKYFVRCFPSFISKVQFGSKSL